MTRCRSTSSRTTICCRRLTLFLFARLTDAKLRTPEPEPAACRAELLRRRQSHCIARRLLRGEWPMPKKLLVLAADPGAEHRDTVRMRDRTLEEFRACGVDAMVAPGPKMLWDLIDRKTVGDPRIDNAAYWTKNADGSRGQAMQKCTREYKIRPMDRLVNAYMRNEMGFSNGRFPENSVERWIGYCWDERSRCKPLQQKFQQVRYPLIDRQETKEQVLQWYAETGEEMPPPSVCNHCWANGTETFKRIAETDPQGFQDAVLFDDLSRDMSLFGFTEQCFCSRTLLPLSDLAANGFTLSSSDAEQQSCDGGYCFI